MYIKRFLHKQKYTFSYIFIVFSVTISTIGSTLRLYPRTFRPFITFFLISWLGISSIAIGLSKFHSTRRTNKLTSWINQPLITYGSALLLLSIECWLILDGIDSILTTTLAKIVGFTFLLLLFIPMVFLCIVSYGLDKQTQHNPVQPL